MAERKFDKELAARLRIKEEFLIENLELTKNRILDHLKEDATHSQAVFDDHDVRRLKQPHLSEKDVVQKFIKILPSKGNNAYHSLKIALRKEGKEDVVQELSKVNITEEDLVPTEGEEKKHHAEEIAKKWIIEHLEEHDGSAVSVSEIVSNLHKVYTVADQRLSDTDLLKVALEIAPDSLMRMAVEFLDLDKKEFDFIKSDARQRDKPTEEMHLDCLIRWRNKKGAMGTRKTLFEIIEKAATKGLLDRTHLEFLSEQRSGVWEGFGISPREVEDLVLSIFPSAKPNKQRKEGKGTKATKEGRWICNVRMQKAVIEKEEAMNQENTESQSSMESWTRADVNEWMGTIGCEDEVIDTFSKQKIDGLALQYLTLDSLEKICPQLVMGDRMRIIIQRDRRLKEEVIPANSASKRSSSSSDESSLSSGSEPFQEQLRPFDSNPDITFKYKVGAVVSVHETRIDNRTNPIHRFIDIEKCNGKNNSLFTMCRQTVLFACACLNDHTNGTIHFGIKEQKIHGMELTADPKTMHQLLATALEDSFDEDVRHVMFGCVRPAKFVEVQLSSSKQKRYVVEIDVRPAYELCGKEIFYAKAPEAIRKSRAFLYGEPLVYRFDKDGEPYALQRGQLKEYEKDKPGLAYNRKRTEELEDRKARELAHPDLKRKLLVALGQDDDSVIRPDLYHLLVLSPPDSEMDRNFFQENLQFIGTTEWKVAFDFDSKSEICNYLVEDREIPMKIISTPEKFDQTKPNVTLERVNSLHEDIKNSYDLSWLFCNGLAKSDVSAAENPREWKRNVHPSFKECVRFFSRGIPQDRAVVVFLLFSKNYDVMMEAADELCTMFPDQFVCIAENESIANPWKENLMQRHCADKEVIDARTIVGMPWAHVQEVFHGLTNPDFIMAPQVPTSTGAPVSLGDSDRQEMSDLDILTYNECENCELDEDAYEDLRQKSEEEFYHGKPVTWWNFACSGQVCSRNIHEELRRLVTDTLRGGFRDDGKVSKVTLFNERGAGGTTAAKHVLWDLRKEYRCAVVKNITENTCNQILKYRSFKEARQRQKAPKPVLIMIDSADDEKVSILLTVLEEKAKHIVRGEFERCDTVCVLLMVTNRSKMQGKQKLLGNHLVLKHELTTAELRWFNKKQKELDRKFQHHEGKDPKNMLSFSILRANFDPNHITERTSQLLKEITSPQEKKLLKYLSLINAFDLAGQEVPTAAFDKLMKPVHDAGFKRKKHWETCLSDTTRVLLNVSSRQAMRKIQALSIIHPLFAKEILYALCITKEGHMQTLSEAVTEFFKEEFVDPDPDKADVTTEILHKIINGILVKRRRFSNCLPETKFSPLIEEIRQRDGDDQAGRVLQEGFGLTRDAFVAQQVSRLFIHTRSWKTAMDYARTAVDSKKENPCVWDTYGRVYRGQVNEKLTSFFERDSRITEDEILETVKLSLEAIRLFQKEQAVALDDKSPLENEVVGYIGELDASVRMLDCLTYLHVFQQDREKFHRFLVDPNYVPDDIVEWKDIDGINYIQEVKRLQQNVTEVISKIEDEQIQQKLETSDEYKCSEAKINARMLATMKENIDSYYGEESDEVPENMSVEEKCMYRRRRIFRLGGYSLRGIYDIRRYDGGEDRLLKILEHANENIFSGLPTNVDDLRVKITAVLALSCIDTHNVHLLKKFKMAEVIAWSTELYQIKSNFRPIRMEPYLFYVMFGWPRKCNESMGLSPSKIEDAIHYWREAYYEKYPTREHQQIRKKDTTIYFLANGSNMASVIDYEQLKSDVGRTKGEAFWRHSRVLKKLQRFRGTLSEDGYSVAVHVEYGQGHKGSIRIPTALVINDRKLWNKTVYFVIGFSWMTPKAFDISARDITEDPEVFTLGQDDFFPTELPVMPFQAGSLTQISFWTQLSDIDKQLREIAMLKGTLKRQRREPTRKQNEKLQQEQRLRKNRKKLLARRQTEIQQMDSEFELSWQF